MPKSAGELMREKWLVISIFVLGFDQFTKYLSTQRLALVDSIAVFPGLDFTLRYNKGAAWSFLANASGWQRWFFIGLTILISIGIYVWLGRLSTKEKQAAFALSLVLGGAFGNLLDRINYGYVIDFILFHYQSWQWPAFNLADTAICIGVALLIPTLVKKH